MMIHDVPAMDPFTTAQFWSRVDTSGDCWEWKGAIDTTGYGNARVGGKRFKAHRLAWVAFNGPVPDNKPIDHRCHNTKCVNPYHLNPVTFRENSENRSGPTKNNKSGYRGVYWDKYRSMWRGEVRSRGVKYEAGRFHNVEDAAQAVLDLRHKLHTNNLADR